MLVTYSKLLDAILAPPPTNSSQIEAEWKQHLEWINILAQNIMAAANDLRPVQARGNLELMMRRQLELRREETKAIHTCVRSASFVSHECSATYIAGNATRWRRNSQNFVYLRRHSFLRPLPLLHRSAQDPRRWRYEYFNPPVSVLLSYMHPCP